MPNDETPDERKTPRSGGGKRSSRVEKGSATERSVIPGRDHAGTSRASIEEEQTRDHTARRGSGPHDDMGEGGDAAPGSMGGASDEGRRD